MKNLNSFRYLQRALEYEIERHIAVLESGGRISQETRLWNVAEGRSESMRSKPNSLSSSSPWPQRTKRA